MSKPYLFLLSLISCTLFTSLAISKPSKNCNLAPFDYKAFGGCPVSPKHSKEINQLVLQKDFSSLEMQQRLILEVLVPTTNLGYTEAKGKKIYRGSFLTYHPTCIKTIVENSKELTLVNIYSGTVPIASDLAELERKQLKLFGVENYLYFQSFHTNASDADLATFIKTIFSLPGDIYIHCFGGIHRTGLVFGIIQKCLNEAPEDLVIQEYRCHAGYESPSQPGSARKFDENRIKDFDCTLLTQSLN